MKEIRENCMVLKQKISGRSEVGDGRIFSKRQHELIFNKLYQRKAVVISKTQTHSSDTHSQCMAAILKERI